MSCARVTRTVTELKSSYSYTIMYNMHIYYGRADGPKRCCHTFVP